MNKMLPRPRFWTEAAKQNIRRRGPLRELLTYFLLIFLAYVFQALVISIPVTGWMMETQSDAMLEALNDGQSVQGVILSAMEEMPDWVSVVSLLGGAGMGIAAIFYCLKFQKRTLSSMGLGKQGLVADSLLGLVLGTALVAAVVALGVTVGGFRLVFPAGSPEKLGLLLLAFLGCLLYGASLELLTRGYFAPTIGAYTPVALALVVSTFVSAMMQAGGTLFSLPMANHLLLGAFLGIWVIKRGNLWGACAIHSAWLFAENFLFDIAPAGEHGGIRLLEVDADPFRTALSGGLYGISNSICTTIILLLAVGAALALRAKDPAPEEPEDAFDEEQHSNFL
ncbi:MAG: CPBP family intramembrane metalloprotease [Oscillospiraceae bacterium]|nr:CPBP family intramembrane metalloprotease [Oscillospiraceae bacterium]